MEFLKHSLHVDRPASMVIVINDHPALADTVKRKELILHDAPRAMIAVDEGEVAFRKIVDQEIVRTMARDQEPEARIVQRQVRRLLWNLTPLHNLVGDVALRHVDADIALDRHNVAQQCLGSAPFIHAELDGDLGRNRSRERYEHL